MAEIIHLRCRRCGDRLEKPGLGYCPPCNLYLGYRAMPFILGLLLTGPITDPQRPMYYPSAEAEEPETMEEQLIWE